jgi:CheY-like chemotaxis protein
VAHEINNPVAYMLANHTYLQDKMATLFRLGALIDEGGEINALRETWTRAGGRAFLDDFRQVLRQTEEGAVRIQDIVRDLRTLARRDDDRHVRVDLNEVIHAALRIAGAQLRSQANVVKKLGSDVHVLGHAGRLSQVFINLLVNAAQAISSGPDKNNEIAVATEKAGDRVVARVSDTGPGISPENLPRIFEPFFTTKGPAVGTGLGLWISHEIICAHGGEIHVESLPGRGATFTITLPTADSSLARSAERPKASPVMAERDRPTGVTATKLRILFVDDEVAMLRIYERAFGHDHEVVMADSGAQAVSHVADRGDFDLIVCDLVMPDVNGMDLYEKACALHPELADAFIFVTGGHNDEVVQSFLRTVNGPVLEKPFDVEVLRKIFDARAARDQAPT